MRRSFIAALFMTAALAGCSSQPTAPATPDATQRPFISSTTPSPQVQKTIKPTPKPTPTTTKPKPVLTTQKPKPKPKPTPKPTPTPSKTTGTVIQGVHPGAFCSQHGSYGRTNDGTLMQCKTSSTDTRYRWRRA